LQSRKGRGQVHVFGLRFQRVAKDERPKNRPDPDFAVPLEVGDRLMAMTCMADSRVASTNWTSRAFDGPMIPLRRAASLPVERRINGPRHDGLVEIELQEFRHTSRCFRGLPDGVAIRNEQNGDLVPFEQGDGYLVLPGEHRGETFVTPRSRVDRACCVAI